MITRGHLFKKSSTISTGTLKCSCYFLLSSLFKKKLPHSPPEEAKGEAPGPSAGEVQRLARSPRDLMNASSCSGQTAISCTPHCIKDSSVLQHWRWSPLPYNNLMPWPATHRWTLRFRSGRLLSKNCQPKSISEATWDLCLCPHIFIPLYKF